MVNLPYPFQVLLSCGLVALMALGGCRSSASKPSRVNSQTAVNFLPNFPSPSYWTAAADGSTPSIVSAHRGRPEMDAYPENCTESLAKLFSLGSFIGEIDVARSSDGVLFLLHDDDLDRVTYHKGKASARVWSDLDTIRLRGPDGRITPFTIPSLAEALQGAKGRGMLALDRKSGVSLAELTQASKQEGMLPFVQLILYDDEDYREWAELDQLGAISHEASSTLKLEELAQRNRELYTRFAISPFRENRSRPATGFLGVGASKPELLQVAKALGIRTAVGTFGEIDDRAAEDGGESYRAIVRSGINIIATNRPLAAAKAVYSMENRELALPRGS